METGVASPHDLLTTVLMVGALLHGLGHLAPAGHLTTELTLSPGAGPAALLIGFLQRLLINRPADAALTLLATAWRWLGLR
jgi:hypothetical protein